MFVHFVESYFFLSIKFFLKNTGRPRFWFPVYIRGSEKKKFFHKKELIWQKLIFHFPGLISNTKNGVFRY